MQKDTIVFICLVCISFFYSCSPKPIPYKTQTALNTVCTIQLFDYGKDKVYKEIFDRLDEIEQKMSVTIKSSEISHINTAAGDFPVTVSNETFYVIEQSLSFAVESRGAFNPAIGPLVSLWNVNGFNILEDDLPLPETVEHTRQKTDYTRVNINQKTQSVFLEESGMALDLGGIAKGWAADQIIGILRAHNIPLGIVNLGGNIYAHGKKANGESWNIGIKNPFNTAGDPIVRIKAFDTSIVTSGMYERFFEKDGVVYHHIIDRETGYPVQNDLVSVTIALPSSMEADALSTLIFALGREKGLEYLDSRSLKGIIITKKYEIYASAAIKNDIEILDPAFTLTY